MRSVERFVYPFKKGLRDLVTHYFRAPESKRRTTAPTESTSVFTCYFTCEGDDRNGRQTLLRCRDRSIELAGLRVFLAGYALLCRSLLSLYLPTLALPPVWEVLLVLDATLTLVAADTPAIVVTYATDALHLRATRRETPDRRTPLY